MSFENPLWVATKMHGELLKLGIRVAESTVSIFIVPWWGQPLQTWKGVIVLGYRRKRASVTQ